MAGIGLEQPNSITGKGNVANVTGESFLDRNQFLIRRLHSLTGLVPVGAYMVVHLLTNASVINSAASFQGMVYTIHSLGRLLPVIEWGFIFLPLIFHAAIGFVIIGGGLQNTGNYPLQSNIRYMLQRVTGVIAALFIFWHVFHMHGWIHADWWITGVAEPLHGAQFRPYNAASTAGMALQPVIVVVLYTIGILATVFHLANGIWTFGITWGIWISPAAQRRATAACLVFGLALAGVGLSALGGMRDVAGSDKLEQTLADEDTIHRVKVEGLEVPTADHKRLTPEERQRLLERAGLAAPEEAASPEEPAAEASP